MTHKNIPQNILSCDKKSADLDCLMQDNLTIDHSKDLMVECQDHDPTDPNKEDGTMELWNAYEGSNDM